MAVTPEVQALLNQMQDIIVPDAVGWWPLSFSLASMIIGLTAILIGIFWAINRSHQDNLYRREAQSLFNEAIQQASTPQQKIEVANSFLKQVSITHYGRKTVAKLTGKDWVDFLKSTASYIDQPEHLAKYFNAHYQANFNFNMDKLEAILEYSQKWIKGHHK